MIWNFLLAASMRMTLRMRMTDDLLVSFNGLIGCITTDLTVTVVAFEGSILWISVCGVSMEDAGVGFLDFIDRSKGPASSVSGGPVSGVSTLCLISVDCSLDVSMTTRESICVVSWEGGLKRCLICTCLRRLSVRL